MKTPQQKARLFCYETGLGRGFEKRAGELLTDEWKDLAKNKSKFYYFRTMMASYFIKKYCEDYN